MNDIKKVLWHIDYQIKMAQTKIDVAEEEQKKRKPTGNVSRGVSDVIDNLYQWIRGLECAKQYINDEFGDASNINLELDEIGMGMR